MSRTLRKVSHRMKKFYGKNIVRDGSITRVAHSCTNHGGCPWCLGNRMHKHAKKLLKTRQQLRNYEL